MAVCLGFIKMLTVTRKEKLLLEGSREKKSNAGQGCYSKQELSLNSIQFGRGKNTKGQETPSPLTAASKQNKQRPEITELNWLL